MGTIHFIKPKKAPLRLVLALLTSHRMDCFILCLRCLERFTDLTRFKRIYILANGLSPEHMTIARRFEQRQENVVVLDCQPPGLVPAVTAAENFIFEMHANDVVIKLDEDIFVTPHWLEHLLDGYQTLRKNARVPLIAPLLPISRNGRRILSRFLKYAYPSERGMFLGPPVEENWVYHRWVWHKIMHEGLVETYLAERPPSKVFTPGVDSNCMLFDRRLMELIHPLPLVQNAEAPYSEAGLINTALRENDMRSAVMGRSLAHHYAYAGCEDYLRAHAPLDDVWGYLDEVRAPRIIAPAKRPERQKGRPVLTLLRSPG